MYDHKYCMWESCNTNNIPLKCNHDNDVAKFKDFLNNLSYFNPCPRRATIVNMIFMTSNLMHYNWSPSHFVQCTFLQDSISHFFWIIQLPMIMHLSIMYKMLYSWRYSQLKINLDIEIPNINHIKMCSF